MGLDAEIQECIDLGDVATAAGQDRLWAQVTPLLGARPFAQHLEAWQAIFSKRRDGDGPAVAWHPADGVHRRTHLAELMEETGHTDYRALHRWSTREREQFWQRSLERIGARFRTQPARILEPSDAEDPGWLPGARLNVVETCFQAPEQNTAIVAGGEDEPTRRITYGELKRLADAVSHGLTARFAPGDAIALYLPMTPECVAAYLGIVQAGMVVVSIPDSFTAGEVATRLRLGGAKAVLTVDSFVRGGREVAVYERAVEAAARLDPTPVCIVIGSGATPLQGDDLAWSDLLEDQGPFTAVERDPQDATNILFSSGTTGEPKAIPWTQMSPFKCAVDGMWHQDIHETDVVSWPTNIGWMMGPWLIYATLMNRATMALYQGAPAAGFLAFAREAEVTVLGVVPAIVRNWRLGDMAQPGALPAVRVFSSTGEASNVEDYLFLMSLSAYRAPVIEYCGGTEVGGGHVTGTLVQPASPATFTTPAMGLDFVVLDEEGHEVPEGSMGELYLVPPSIGLSQRLLNRDHHEEYYAGCPPGPNGETLRRHGDEMQRLPNGFWAAQGRADDTMNLGGIKVGSIELERAMDGHPVRETAAVGIRPAGGGAEQLVVFAVLEEPTGTDDLQRLLQQRIKKRLNPLFRIHEVVPVDTLPRTASNKIMRRELRARHQQVPA